MKQKLKVATNIVLVALLVVLSGCGERKFDHYSKLVDKEISLSDSCKDNGDMSGRISHIQKGYTYFDSMRMYNGSTEIVKP